MPNQPTAAGMRLAKELDTLGLVYRWDSVARALDDAGVREAVDALQWTNDVFILHGVNRGELPGDMKVAYDKIHSALSALTGEAHEA